MKKIILSLSLALCSATMCWSNEASSNQTPQYPFYQSYIELSGRMTSPLSGGAAIEMINGCRLNKYVFVGGGVGVTSYFLIQNIENYKEMISTPLYADIRAYAPMRTSNVTPYIEAAVGPLFNYYGYVVSEVPNYVDPIGDPLDCPIDRPMAYSTMAYFKVGVGIDIIDRFTIGAGYELWGDKNRMLNFGFLKLGVRIGQDKNVY